MPVETELRFSRIIVNLSRRELRAMLQLAHCLYRLSQNPDYRQLVFPALPETARVDPGHGSLMMGYDFHLSEDGPRLIEVNTNAGGGYISWLSEKAAVASSPGINFARFEERLHRSFLQEWHDFSGGNRPLSTVAIVDEDPEEQALYEEMIAYRDWLQGQGIATEVVAPQQLQATAAGVFLGERRIDLVYNRHCDFYLETTAMAGLKEAYLGRSVCLSPNPFAYGLLADKRRMILWSDAQALQPLQLDPKEQELLLQMVPQTRLLADFAVDEVWDQRKDYIFKPVASFGAKGVLMGKSVSRKRFAELDPQDTLVQQVILPATQEGPDGDEYKSDIRLYVYRDRLLGIGARLYQGQVTNLRTEGGGFAPVRLR